MPVKHSKQLAIMCSVMFKVTAITTTTTTTATSLKDFLSFPTTWFLFFDVLLHSWCAHFVILVHFNG